MASSPPWSARSGTERRRTIGLFALLYAAIALVAIAMNWIGIAIVFAVLTIGLAIGRWRVDADEVAPATQEEREKPAWMKAMDDPDSPDLSLPEYRGTPREAAEGTSPDERPPDTDGVSSPSADQPGQEPPPSPTG